MDTVGLLICERERRVDFWCTADHRHCGEDTRCGVAIEVPGHPRDARSRPSTGPVDNAVEGWRETPVSV
jgi:hypothetical protein